MNQEDIAWAAGFLEGEGTIGVYFANRPKRSSSEYYPLVEAGNTEKLLIDRLHGLFGGYVLTVYRSGYAKTGGNARKDYYRWRVTNRKALKVARLILPFLVGEKREGAQCIIDWYASGEHNLGGYRPRKNKGG